MEHPDKCKVIDGKEKDNRDEMNDKISAIGRSRVWLTCCRLPAAGVIAVHDAVELDTTDDWIEPECDIQIFFQNLPLQLAFHYHLNPHLVNCSMRSPQTHCVRPFSPLHLLACPLASVFDQTSTVIPEISIWKKTLVFCVLLKLWYERFVLHRAASLCAVHLFIHWFPLRKEQFDLLNLETKTFFTFSFSFWNPQYLVYNTCAW